MMKKISEGASESSMKKKKIKSKKIVKTTEDFLSPKKISKKAAKADQEGVFQKSPSKKSKASKKEPKPEKQKNLKALSHALPINSKEC